MKFPKLCYFFLGLLLVLCACSKEDQSGDTVVPAPGSVAADVKTYFPIKLGNETPRLQLALSDSERTLGLMFRESLDQGHGMLFVFEKATRQSFWMKNTRIPLDIGYFDAGGTLLEVHKLYPFDKNPVLSNSREIQIVAEMNRGWFAAYNIRPGAQLDMQALLTAIKARGLVPGVFQLQAEQE